MNFILEEIDYTPVHCEEAFNAIGQPVINWTIQIWNKEITFCGYPSMKQLMLASDTNEKDWEDGFIFNNLKKWKQWDIFEFIINDLEIIRVVPTEADERNRVIQLVNNLANAHFN